MAKKKKQHPQSAPISAEKFIRTKARQLPVYECFVNKNWKWSQIANVVVSRKQLNDNLTYVMYLVDLACLGVKNVGYYYNQDQIDFGDYKKKILDNDFISIDYSLAHNIIFAGYEFANDYGFKAHKDFLNTAIYFLDEDTDDVPLIEIECGRNGKPYVIEGPYNRSESRKAVLHLSKTVGPDGFIFEVFNEDDSFSMDDDENYEACRNIVDSYSYNGQNDPQQDKDFEIFSTRAPRAQELGLPDHLRDAALRLTISALDTDMLIDEMNDLIGDIKVLRLMQVYLPEEMLFGTTGINHIETIEINEAIDSMHNLNMGDGNKYAQAYIQYLNQHTDVPYFSFMSQLMDNKLRKNDYERFCQVYPDCHIIKLISAKENEPMARQLIVLDSADFSIIEFFNGRTNLNTFEFVSLIEAMIAVCECTNNAYRLVAIQLLLMHDFLSDIELISSEILDKLYLQMGFTAFKMVLPA